jgi:hypothetical protein
MRNSLIILALLVATACMSGCVGGMPIPVVQVLTPPDGLLQDCVHASRPTGNTMADLAQAVINERGVTESCDWADKAALRAWKATATAPAAK